MPRSVVRVVRTSGPLPPMLIRPTLLSGLSCRTWSATMLTLSAWASKRDGWKSPFREDSLLSTTIMHAVKGILMGWLRDLCGIIRWFFSGYKTIDDAARGFEVEQQLLWWECVCVCVCVYVYVCDVFLGVNKAESYVERYFVQYAREATTYYLLPGPTIAHSRHNWT